MKIRQSDIKTWFRCPLQYKFQKEGTAREQSSALSFGTALHESVMAMEVAYDLSVGLDRFDQIWSDLSAHDLQYDYLLPRNTHQGYGSEGKRIVSDWWKLICWETDVVLAREYSFEVPLGEHTLVGTVDKLAVRQIKGERVVLVSDYKTNSKQPTRDYLAHDIQFSAYAYATTRPEFWAGLEDGLYESLRGCKRVGEWVHLRGPKRLDAGERTQMHYNRLQYAVDNIAASVECGIFVPNISGESCEYCEFRRPCGLPTREQEGLA